MAMPRPDCLSEKPSGFEVAIGGIVSLVRVMRTKKGDPMGVVLLEDWEGIVEVLVFPGHLRKDPAACSMPTRRFSFEASSTTTNRHQDPGDRYLSHGARQGDPEPHRDHSHRCSTRPTDIAERLQPVIDEKRGSAEIIFELEFPGRYTALVRPNPYVKISPDREFVESVERICGPNTVRLELAAHSKYGTPLGVRKGHSSHAIPAPILSGLCRASVHRLFIEIHGDRKFARRSRDRHRIRLLPRNGRFA